MTGEVKYLETYSVAPAPSRDYYGIRILPNEVKLFLWKISHGPHRTPIIRNVKFSELASDKSLQDEIHRVFGRSLLEYVKDIAEGRRKNWDSNSSELDPGWARVLFEGKSMQKTETRNACLEFGNKRGVRSKVVISGLKGNNRSRNRSNILSKTPLEVIKTNPVTKKIVNKPEVVTTTAGISIKPVNELSSKMSRVKFQKGEENKTTARGVKSETKVVSGAKIETIKLPREATKHINSSKSTIFKTDKSLTKGFSSLQKKDVNLADLIREDAMKIRGRTRGNFDELIVADVAGKSKDSSSGNYDIENPWSSNSSITSIESKNRARPMENCSNFPKFGVSRAKAVDAIERLTTLYPRNRNFGSSISKISRSGQLPSAASNNFRPSTSKSGKFKK